MDRARLPGLTPGQRHPDWQRLYESANEETLPWYFPKIDPDIQGELTLHARGKLLDVGCGLGNQTALLAEMGFDVIGTDVSKAAIARARSLHPGPRFEVDDVTDTILDDKFNFVVDRGCFHVLDPHFHQRYVTSAHMWLRPGGILLLKVFSGERGPVDFGPQRFCRAELRDLFDGDFEISKTEETIYQGLSPTPQPALFLVMKRKAQ